MPSAQRRPSVSRQRLAARTATKASTPPPATEADDRAPGFLADLCHEWEAAARAAEELGVRVAIVRNGFVIGPDAKALELLVLPFRLHVGGRLGSGRQWMSWVHVDDVVGIMTMAIDTPEASGPFNAVSPEPVHEADVAAAIGGPSAAARGCRSRRCPIRLVLRDVSVLILGIRPGDPDPRSALGYRFRWTDLDAAMRDVLGSAR